MKKAQGVPDWAVMLVVALMVVGFGWFIMRADKPPKSAAINAPIAAAMAQQAVESDDHFMKRIRKAARQTNGDWTRLSPSDQHVLDAHTGGHGRGMFTMMVKDADAKDPNVKESKERKTKEKESTEKENTPTERPAPPLTSPSTHEPHE